MSLPDPAERIALVIPAYNHPGQVSRVIDEALALGWPVIVVDDGSTDRTRSLLASIRGIHTLRHPRNRGKGAALLTGMRAAAELADWAVTLDADGQHRPADAPSLVTAIDSGQRAIVVGNRQRMQGGGVPWTSSMGRRFSNLWVRTAGGPQLADTQCGFRLYPLPETLDLPVRSRRFQFEVEVLVKAVWHGLPVKSAPVSVAYRPGGRRISHFHPFIDFCRNFAVFTRLIFQRVVLSAERRKQI